MPTITRWADIKVRAMQASGGGCDEADAIIIANEAIPALLNKGPWLGSVADVSLKLFQPSFSLPYQYERAITAEQCFNGDLIMGWYAIQNASSYVDPKLWGDSVLIDEGTHPTERPFYGQGKVYAQARYPEDASVVVRIYGTLYGQQQYIQPAGTDGMFKAQDFEDLPPDGTLSTADYDALTEIRKPVTKGPIDICAMTPSGQSYVLVSLAPYETEAARRWYKFPELRQLIIHPRSITPADNGFAFDTQFEQAPLKAGDSVAIQGFCPTQFNGLWTVYAVVESKVYVQALPQSGWTMPDGEISVFGKVTLAACLTCSCLKRFIPIVDDASDVILSNKQAIRSAIRAIWAQDKGAHAEFDKWMDEAVMILRDEVTRYGNDPTHELNRRAQYQYQVRTQPPETAGYIVARLALELPGALQSGRKDLYRYLNEAQQYIISSGKYGDSTEKRNYQVGAGGLVIMEPDAQSILVASIGGKECMVQSIYYDSTTNKGLIGYGIDGPTGYQAGGFFTNGSLAGGQPRTIVLAQQESIMDEDGCCRSVYKVEPCQAMARCCVCAVVKLRYLPVYCKDDIVIVPNYAALKMMVQAITTREAKDYGGFEAIKNAAFKLLDMEKRHKKGGAQSRMKYASTFTGRYFRGRGR